ncbi:unnamed protein product [Rotaria sp. Silwood2]|nr:unnamed protein product [Rotaria sp. Silwood2]
MQSSDVDMNFCSSSLLQKTSDEKYIQSKTSNIKSKQILSGFINNHLERSRKLSSSYHVRNRHRRRHCRRIPLTFDINHKSKDSNELKNQLSLNNNKINIESLKPIENIEQEENHVNNSDEQIKAQQAQLQRAIYNAKQTPLIPLIVDIDYRSLFDLSQQEYGLLINILNLLRNSLINPTTTSNNFDDEEIAQQHQEQFFYENLRHADESSSTTMTSIDMRPLEEIEADAAYAFQLQEEEYSKNSITPFLSYQQNSGDKHPSHPIVNFGGQIILSDAELAAHLQAEENHQQQQQQQRRNQRRIPQPTTNRNYQSNESENITIPPFASPTNPPSFGGNNNRAAPNVLSLIRTLASSGVTSRGSPNFRSHRNRNIENIDEDFGPNDYENLLQLDESVNKNALSSDQINRLPTEKFRRLPNTTTEEKQCSVCWDEFEPNQTLRRLPCLHRYHQSCIDNWLKTKNLCPVCRTPPIK